MSKFFKNVKTIEELKKEYRRLAFQFHPDRGGDLETMKVLNTEYDEMLKVLAHTANKEQEELRYAEEFKEVIEQLINCAGLEIEICGSWLWVSGNTFQHKALLKELGFQWRKKKSMWSLGTLAGGKHKEWDMDRIRNTFGSEKIASKGNFIPQLV
jgi:calcineurin-like phosphoesterase family protein